MSNSTLPGWKSQCRNRPSKGGAGLRITLIAAAPSCFRPGRNGQGWRLDGCGPRAGPSTRRRPWPRTPATSRPQAAYVPHLLNMLQQVVAYEDPTAEDPAAFGAISAPVLVLHGSDTIPFYHASARHLADHIPNAQVREIPGAGHAVPLTHPKTLAKTFAEFFVAARPSGLVS
ncbi:alpha/beta fold hydrolase [Nonomuraea sp. NPDC050451]|uniref:alpha/beta fold hydrolase n=1 Tax=Nonomuraea sp. NPDC050451 TaxID=3364364 RepID=UPI003791D3FF